MGFLNFVLLMVFAVIISIAAQFSIGFANVVFIFLILYVLVMQKMVLSSDNSWKRIIGGEGKKFDSLINKSDVRYFLRGKLFWRTSVFQLVYHAKDNDSKYWFVCGSWIFGSFSKKVMVYEEKTQNGELKLINDICK